MAKPHEEGNSIPETANHKIVVSICYKHMVEIEALPEGVGAGGRKWVKVSGNKVART